MGLVRGREDLAERHDRLHWEAAAEFGQLEEAARRSLQHHRAKCADRLGLRLDGCPAGNPSLGPADDQRVGTAHAEVQDQPPDPGPDPLSQELSGHEGSLIPSLLR